jgi:NAD(P)-dependent dehydrogenase (short-subunit alcohol dehydrogenase family)
MARLDGKVAFITGAGSGIGFATALRFAHEGAIVVGLDLAECPDWKQVADAARGASYHTADVRDAAAQDAAVAAVLEQHGGIDVLVTAAGIAGGGPVHLISADDWQRVQDVNLTGTFLSAKAVLPSMIARRRGSIVTIASVEGIEGCEGGSTYNASKGGVVLLTKNMAVPQDGRRRAARAEPRAHPRAAQARPLRARRGGRSCGAVPRLRRRVVRIGRHTAGRRRLHGRSLRGRGRADGPGGLVRRRCDF